MALFGKSSDSKGDSKAKSESTQAVSQGDRSGRSSDGSSHSPHTEAAPPQQALAGGGKSVANIGKSISIKGDLSGEEDLSIDGKVEGRVDLPSHQLTIGETGQVEAEISAKRVVVIGRVAGNVNATERIEIQGTGIVEGDIRSPRLVVAEGAVINGAIDMSKTKEKVPVKPVEDAKPRATASGGGGALPQRPASAPR
ncbi:MAG: polymer-forming cytoskeletal protein [Proteobacteria bacterium]|nr:polymer-forming cytoskeletal protein [Pseudomonadota bacterium]